MKIIKSLSILIIFTVNPLILWGQQGGLKHTKQSVPWSMGAYKLVEYYNGKEGHQELYDGEKLIVSGIVSSIEKGPAILLFKDRIMVLPADRANPEFMALISFFNRESGTVSSRPKSYRNFYIKASFRGVCQKSTRASKIDLRDAELLAWYGVIVTRSGNSISFSISNQMSNERIPEYRQTEWEQEKKEISGVLDRVNFMSRTLSLIVDKLTCHTSTDPLSLATEAEMISGICRSNAFRDPLKLRLTAYPSDEFGRRFHEATINSWEANNSAISLYDVVNNIGGIIDMEKPVPEEKAVAAAIAAAPIEEAGAAAGTTGADLKIGQLFAIAGNNLLAENLDHPDGRFFLALAEYLLPKHPTLIDMRAKVNTRTPLERTGTGISKFDLIEQVMKRAGELSNSRSLNNPARRKLCAVYVAVAKNMDVPHSELRPIIMSLEMYDQGIDLKELTGIDLSKFGPGKDIAELEKAVSGDNPETVDELLSKANDLKSRAGDNPRLAVIIQRLQQYQKYWNEEVPCPDCDGSGEKSKNCSVCNGSGKQTCTRCRWTGKIREEITCPKCNGSGKKFFRTCKNCQGKGIIEEIRDCPDCNGSGTVSCQACKGTGETSEKCTACDGSGKRKRRELMR